jgi:hypothetical protein
VERTGLASDIAKLELGLVGGARLHLAAEGPLAIADDHRTEHGKKGECPPV